MKCNQEYHKIVFEISDKEFEKHLSECQSCNELNKKVNDTMSVLDNTIEVPEGMVEAILIKKRKIEAHKIKRWKLSNYAQIAAILIAGVFMGVILGRNANTSLLQSAESKKSKSLTEFYEMHHLKVDNSTSFNKLNL